ncbi:Uncharacterised protein g330 [Pycnogonum litorale]
MNCFQRSAESKIDDEKIPVSSVTRRKIWVFEFDLPVIEVIIYLTVWVSSLFYSLYVIYKELLFHKTAFADHGFLVNGWFGYLRDVSDLELSTVIETYKSSCLWILGFVIICKLSSPRRIIPIHVIYSVMYLVYIFDVKLAFLLIFPIYFLYLFNLFGVKYLTFFTGFFLIFFQHTMTFESLLDHITSDFVVQNRFVITLSWIILRAISFNIDNEKNSHSRLSEELFRMVYYCLYFPSILYGPFVGYKDFDAQLKASASKKPVGISNVFCLISRYLFWFVVLMFGLHVWSANACRHYPQIIRSLSTWGFSGLFYAISTLFMLKYTIIYGFPQVLASIDNITFPSPPRCVSWIPLYSYMWRYFDPGLYYFMKQYIYIPLVKYLPRNLAKLLSSSACFSFIFIWHGASKRIFVWSFFNFLGIAIENLMNFIIRCDISRQIAQRISKASSRRLKAFFVMPIFVMSCISEVFFLVNYKAGIVLFRKIFVTGFPTVTLNVAFIFYCASHVGLIVLEWFTKKSSNLRKDT